MVPRSFSPIGVCALGFVMLSASCGATSADGADRRVVTVFAAASLGDAFGEIEAAIEEAHPEIDVRLSLAGSSTLREQILDGAPADVFAAANEAVMSDVIDAGEATASQVFATNHLVIAANIKTAPASVALADFERSDLLIGVCAPEVPCGSAATEVFASAGVVPSLDTQEPDVRRLLAKIIDGELDLGLVYATDAAVAGDGVVAIELPAAFRPVSNYTIAILEGAAKADDAALVVDFITSIDGQAVLESFGFGP